MKGKTAVPLQRCMQGSSTQAFRRQHFLWVPLLNRKRSRSEPSGRRDQPPTLCPNTELPLPAQPQSRLIHCAPFVSDTVISYSHDRCWTSSIKAKTNRHWRVASPPKKQTKKVMSVYECSALPPSRTATGPSSGRAPTSSPDWTPSGFAPGAVGSPSPGRWP